MRRCHLAWIGICVINTMIFARTVHVPGDYATLQKAVDAAGDGDVILVKEGTYKGAGNRNVMIKGKSLTIRSEGGAGTCVIDCEYRGRAFCVLGTGDDPVTIEGITVVNGWPNYDLDIEETGYGGAVYGSESLLVIHDCVLKGNRVEDQGGAIYGYETDLVLEDCVIRENRAECGWGGIYCYGNVSLVRCVVEENAGGGLYVEQDEETSLTIRQSRINANRPFRDVDGYEEYGGGIYFAYGQLTMEDCQVKGNRNVETGSGIQGSEVSGTIVRCEISNNVGGGVWIDGWDEKVIRFEDCTISNNTPVKEELWYDSGSGIYIEGGQSLIVENCRIRGNRATQNGGGLYSSSDEVVIRQSQIENNVSVSCFGGGICADEKLVLTDCVIQSNKSIVDEDGWGDCKGGGVYCWAAEVQKCRISRNAAEGGSSGGGIYVESELHMSDCEVSHNIILADEDGDAGGDGGGGICGSTCEISSSRIFMNRVQGRYGYGGGVSCYDVTLTDCEICDNEVELDGEGGGVYIGEGVLNHCLLNGNRTGSAGFGGGLCCDEAEIADCQIRQNTAGAGGYGGGVSSYYDLTMLNSHVSGNVVGESGFGGGVSFSDGTIGNCIFSGNVAGADGIGGAIDIEGDSVIANCTIVGNSAGSYGGGVSVEFGKAELLNSILWQNRAGEGSQLALLTTDTEHYAGEESETSETPGETEEPETTTTPEKYQPILCDVVLSRSADCVRICDLKVIPAAVSEESESGVLETSEIGETVVSCEPHTIVLPKPTTLLGLKPGWLMADSLTAGTMDNAGQSIRYSEAEVSYCTVEGGEEGVFVDRGCQLTWGEGNLSSYPAFCSPGYWKGDRWIDGDYQLSVGSTCIDSGGEAIVEKTVSGQDKEPVVAYGIVVTPEIAADPANAAFWSMENITVPTDGGLCMYNSIDGAVTACSALAGGAAVCEVSYREAQAVNVTELSDTDINGAERVLGGSVDRGAMEYQNKASESEESPAHEGDLAILRMTVRMGRSEGLGAFVVQGRFGDDYKLEERQVFMESAESVMVRVGPFAQGVPASDFKSAGRSTIYTYRKNNAAGITLLQLNLKRGTFRIVGKNAYLAGIACPINIELTFGGYQGTGPAESDQVNRGKGF